jgi:Fic-DOC domain mobile mystery protein B
VSDLFEEPDNATPLTPEERNALIPAHIAYRRELNEAEQENIYRAQDWALATRRELLTERFVKDLHGRMLGDVWRWAGKLRTVERNIGIPHYEIPMALHQLLDDAKTWIKYDSYPRDEIAVRVHLGLCRFIHSRTVMAGTPGSWRIFSSCASAGSGFPGAAPTCRMPAMYARAMSPPSGLPTTTISRRS